MTKRKVTTPFANNDIYYDLYEDYNIIDCDFRRVHKITLEEALKDENSNMSLFSAQLQSLGQESLLYHYINIRSEKDPVKIRKFNSTEKKIYLDWKKKHSGLKIQDKKSQELYEFERNVRVNNFLDALCKSSKNKGFGLITEKR